MVRRARERYRLPITHVVVDLEHESVESDTDARPLRRGSSGRRLRLFHASDYDEAMAIQSLSLIHISELPLPA